MDNFPATPVRRRRRQVLRGPITVEYSTRLGFPKLHVDAGCEGLASTPEAARATLRFSSSEDLAAFEEGRPCRMCTLEPLLRTLLRAGAEPAVLVTFTSQPNPSSPDDSVFSYNWGAVTASGTKRLIRLARAGGLEVCQTPSCGPAAYGLVSAETARALAWNLRTHTLIGSEAVPSREAIEIFWALSNDTPPQLADATADAPLLDQWQIAVALTS
jgi:hypothetical protein